MGSIGETVGKLLARASTEAPCARCGKPARAHHCPDCFEALRVASWNKAWLALHDRVAKRLPTSFQDVGLNGEGAARLEARIRRGDPRAAIETARRSVGAARSLVLVGPSGYGKTSTAAATLLAHVGRIVPPFPDRDDEEPGSGWRWHAAESLLYVHALAIPGARLAHGAGNGEAPLVLDAMLAPVLLVDDLGLEPRSPTMIEILISRGDNRLPTIVTTTLQHEELIERYGEGVARRLLAGADVIALWGST